MKIRSVLLVGLASAALSGLCLAPRLLAQNPSPTATASADGWFNHPLRFMFLRRALAHLDVTDEQKQQALAVLRNHQPAITPLVDSLIKERIALRTLFKAPTIDEGAVRAQSARVAVVEADLAVQKAYLIHDLRALATPDQLKKLDELEVKAQARLTAIIEMVNAWIASSQVRTSLLPFPDSLFFAPL